MTPRKTAICCVLLVSGVAACPAMAESVIVFVPHNYTTIQSAIDAVNDGAIIIVWPGTYNEHIDFKGKLIHVRSSNPTDPQTVEYTVIDGRGTGSVVTFDEGETNGAILSGFTIRNGWHGVRVLNSSPWIRYCVIQDNDAGGDTTPRASGGTDWGGGIAVGYDYRYAQQGSYEYAVQIENCTIKQNRAIGAGGIYFHGHSNGTLVSSNVISYNSTYDTFNPDRDGYGGGGYVNNLTQNPSSLTMINNQFHENGVITDPTEGGDLVTAIWAYYVTFNFNVLTGHAFFGAPVRLTGCRADGNQILDVHCHRWEEEPCEKYAVALLGQGTVFTNNIVETGLSVAEGADATFNVCTIVGPLRVSNGATATMKNSIIWPIPATQSVVIVGSGVASIEYSDVRGGYAGVQNFDQDPDFVLPELMDYHISCDSPCYERGQLAVDYSGPTHDVDAQLRPVGDQVDVGADEKQLGECP